MPSLFAFLFVFLGGGLGSVARFFLSTLAMRYFGGGFPVGTLAVNVVGSLFIGVIVALAGKSAGILSDNARFFLAVGFCGGFTTFSTFSLETFTILQEGRALAALGYALASVCSCVTATATGLGLTYWLLKLRAAL
jgi:CrcB protein